MPNQNIVGEFYQSDILRRVVSGQPKQDQIKDYNRWAPIYDSELVGLEPTYQDKGVRLLIDSLGSPNEPVHLLDAACGTGTPASYMRRLARENGINLHLTGVDFSAEMLAVAKKKEVYDVLQVADLMEPLPFESGSFDAFLAIGLFNDGHCGPEVLSNIASRVKKGGIGCITVRSETFAARKDKYLNEFKQCHLRIIKNIVSDYLTHKKANFIVLEKVQ